MYLASSMVKSTSKNIVGQVISGDICCPVCNADGHAVITRRFDDRKIVRCSACGHMYLSPPLPNDVIDKIYSRDYFAYGPKEKTALEEMTGWVNDPSGQYMYALDAVEKTGGFYSKRVLDVGCGTGHFLNECQKRGAAVSGIDPSPFAASIAKRYFNLDIIPLTLDEAFCDHRISPGLFDIVFCFEVIEHIPHLLHFTKLLKSLLSPLGTLIISTPNFGLFWNMGTVTPAIKGNIEHLHYFDMTSLGYALGKCDLRPLKMVTVSPLTSKQRIKIRLINNVTIKSIWRAVRKLAVVRMLKDMIMGSFYSQNDDLDTKKLSGTHIVCFAESMDRRACQSM